MERTTQITLGNRALATPCFFPSVSSVKANLKPSEYLQVLVEARFPQFLFSAYDFATADDSEKKTIVTYLNTAVADGRAALLDSGNYESYWHGDNTWTAPRYESTVVILQPTAAFSFDEQHPPEDSQGAAQVATERATADQTALPGVDIIPIVHATREKLPEVATIVARTLRPHMLGIPERELGEGLTQRCRTLASIRSAINQLDFYCPIHLLGTGNPYSMLAFALCGADSFDGLEWCHTAVDYETGQLSHLQHWDLFSMSSPLNAVEGVPYQQKVLAHNLVFFAEFMNSVRELLKTSQSTLLIERILKRIRPALPVHIG